MLNLPETQHTTQSWRSVGPALFSQAGKKKKPYIYRGEKCCKRRLYSRIESIYIHYVQHTFPVSLTVFELIKRKGSYAASSMNLNRIFSH